jgi:hypothetical protein
MAALQDLARELGENGAGSIPGDLRGESEGAAQAAVRLEAAQKGVRLYRNNVGSLKDERGVPVRYGLANESAAMNKLLKSSDLVGWRRRVIMPWEVPETGLLIGQTVLREMKAPGWTYSGTEREEAQRRFLLLGAADGCDAQFCTGSGTL